MKHRILAVAIAITVSLTSMAPVSADDDGNIATVSFGIGLNTAVAPPANGEPNHHVLPQTVRIKKGGVVNFMVAGFHEIFIYQPGIKLSDVEPLIPPGGPFVNVLPANLYYRGIAPAGGPLNTPATPNIPTPPGPTTDQRTNAANRVESVSFSEPGTYLVICNVRVHLNDGMYAYVVVSKGNDKDSNGKGGK